MRRTIKPRVTRALTRRSFLKYTGATTLTLFAAGRLGLRRAIAAALPGGTLDPQTVPKFVTPLLIPPVMPKAAVIPLRGGRNADYYEISVRQFNQQILPAGFGATTGQYVWHCHIVEHEDNEMMRPYRIGPVQPGQPGG